MAQFSESFSIDGDYTKSSSGQKINFDNPGFSLRNTEFDIDFSTWPKNTNVSGLYHLSDLIDHSGNGNTAELSFGSTNIASIQGTTKKLGTASVFLNNTTSADRTATLKIPTSVVGTLESYCVSFWIKFDHFNNYFDIIATGNASTLPYHIFRYASTVSGITRHFFFNQKNSSGTANNMGFDVDLDIDTWYHFLIKKEQNEFTPTLADYYVYINGVKIMEMLNRNNIDFKTDSTYNFLKMGQPFDVATASGTINILKGYIDEVIYLFDEVWTEEEIEYIYNNQKLNYWIDKPYITNVSDFTDTIVAFTSASQTTSGTGTLALNISIDSGTTWLYWNGSTWVSTDGLGSNYNTIATVNTNIPSLNADPNKIRYRRFFTSDGTQNSSITSAITGYDANQSPVLVIGEDKSTQDQHSSFKPFEGTTFSDPDGDDLQFEYKKNLESWIGITQGAFGTLQEAVQDKDIIFNYADGASQTLHARITDTGAKVDEDSKTITVTKYQLTVNFTEAEGRVLTNLKYQLVGGELTTFDSPLELEFTYNESEISIMIEKSGFETFYVYYTSTADQIQNHVLQTGTVPAIGEIDIDIENEEILIDIE